MTPADGLAAAFRDGPADPQDPAQRRRFFLQAYWLGTCAQLVYPPNSPEFEAENQLDAVAEESKRKYRRLRPWWKVLFKKTPEQQQAEVDWHEAEGEWGKAAKARIEQQVGELWGPGKDAKPEHFSIEFVSCVGTQCFVARDDKTMIVCFRGTEPKKRWDILLDLLSVQAGDDAVHTGNVHLGFWTGLDHVWSEIGSPIAGRPLPELLKEDSLRDNKQTVWITGHSLGGALATAAADRLRVTRLLDENDVGGVFTFGQPRVGDKKFSKDYASNPRHYRFVNGNDVVTWVPLKNLKIVSMIFGALLRRGLSDPPPAKKVAPAVATPTEGASADASADSSSESDGRSQVMSLEYGDVGTVAFAGRNSGFKLLSQGFAGGAQLFWGRMMSRLAAPFSSSFKPPRVTARFFPGLADHSMEEYNRHLLDTQSIDEQ